MATTKAKATTKDKEDNLRPIPDKPVDYVRAVDLEERLNKIILLLEVQNKAWQKCLTLLTDTNTMLFERYKSEDRLLEEHPPVRGPSPAPASAPVETAMPTQPFNNYTDSIPYGGDIEEEREAPPQSFPPRAQTDIPDSPPEYSQGGVGPEYTQGESPPGYGDEPAPTSESAAPNSAEAAPQEPKMRVAPGPPVSSKAELLERVEKVS